MNKHIFFSGRHLSQLGNSHSSARLQLGSVHGNCSSQSPLLSSAKMQTCCCCLAPAVAALHSPACWGAGQGQAPALEAAALADTPFTIPSCSGCRACHPPSKTDVRKTLKSFRTPPSQQAVGFFFLTKEYFKFCILFYHCRCNPRFAGAAVAAADPVRCAQAQPHCSHTLAAAQDGASLCGIRERCPLSLPAVLGLTGERAWAAHTQCLPWCSGCSLRHLLTVIPAWE